LSISATSIGVNVSLGLLKFALLHDTIKRVAMEVRININLFIIFRFNLF